MLFKIKFVFYAVKFFKNILLNIFKQGGGGVRPMRRRWIRLCSYYMGSADALMQF